jgi:hypothetical protein
MRTFRGGLLLAFLAACGGAGAKAKGPSASSEFKAGVKVRITDGGQIYDALNTTTCVKWPSTDVKKRAGRDAWKDFAPNSGLEGTVVAALDHCDHQTLVVLVAVDDYIVPVTSKGVEIPKAGVFGDGLAEQPPPSGEYDEYGYGGYDYGGAYGGYVDPYYGGGYGGYGYGGYGYGVGTTSGSVLPGDVVSITDNGAVYPDINTIDCLTWPSDDVKTRGGSSEWNGWYPSNGDSGTVLAVSMHCNSSDEILIVEMDSGYVVPVGTYGVTIL